MARRRQKDPVEGKEPDPRAKRFTSEQHEHALTLVVGGMLREAVAAEVGCTTESLRRWYKAAEAGGRLPVLPAAPKSAPGGRVAAAPVSAPAEVGAAERGPTTSSAPKDPGSGLAEYEVAAILELKQKHASMGPAQLRAQLKRWKGWRVSTKAIARVLKRAGYALVHRGSRPADEPPPVRFEAPHRNALWQCDFKELRVGPEERYLLLFEDDFSRFVVGYSFNERPTTEVAVATFKEAMRRHGKPERIYSDRGSAFTAWRDITDFETYLESLEIDHSLRRAHHPRGGGKVEALVGTVERELWHTTHFESLDEALEGLRRFIDEYNHRRAHLGIGGLVPADRFYGRWPEVAAEIDAVSRRRQGALAIGQDRRLYHEPVAPGDRTLVLELVFVGDEAELRLCGRRVRLGRIEP
jgi:transposase InsO family protein